MGRRRRRRRGRHMKALHWSKDRNALAGGSCLRPARDQIPLLPLALKQPEGSGLDAERTAKMNKCTS